MTCFAPNGATHNGGDDTGDAENPRDSLPISSELLLMLKLVFQLLNLLLLFVFAEPASVSPWSANDEREHGEGNENEWFH
jgi:hypothetical protein